MGTCSCPLHDESVKDRLSAPWALFLCSSFLDLRPHCVWELHSLPGAGGAACRAQPLGHIRWGLYSGILYRTDSRAKLLSPLPSICLTHCQFKILPPALTVNVCVWVMSEVVSLLYSWVVLWNLFTLPTLKWAWMETGKWSSVSVIVFTKCCCCLLSLHYLPILFWCS